MPPWITLINDAHTTFPLELKGGLRIEAEHLIGDLNAAMAWVEYPGRRNGTADAAEVDFASPGGNGPGPGSM